MAKIYALQCTVNGKSYIGCTTGNLPKRMREHRCMLRKGIHHSPKLQDDWNALGEQVFEMKLLQTLSDGATLTEKRKGELAWIKYHAERGLLYNANLESFAPTEAARRKGIELSKHVAGNRWTPEVNEKRRLAQLGKPKGHGAKISATKRARKQARDEIV